MTRAVNITFRNFPFLPGLTLSAARFGGAYDVGDCPVKQSAAHLKRLHERFGERLKALRIASGFEDAERFAAELGLKPQRYRRYERGETIPPLDVLDLMCKMLDKPLGFILLGHPDKTGK